jgi:hypothetical protein
MDIHPCSFTGLNNGPKAFLAWGIFDVSEHFCNKAKVNENRNSNAVVVDAICDNVIHHHPPTYCNLGVFEYHFLDCLDDIEKKKGGQVWRIPGKMKTNSSQVVQMGGAIFLNTPTNSGWFNSINTPHKLIIPHPGSSTLHSHENHCFSHGSEWKKERKRIQIDSTMAVPHTMATQDWEVSFTISSDNSDEIIDWILSHHPLLFTPCPMPLSCSTDHTSSNFGTIMSLIVKTTKTCNSVWRFKHMSWITSRGWW